ncbi:hypothetical protein [Paracoccus yeei]|jgi:hypothetical protein|uniref:hypothetical protein n=1 Tax=Paracoccus yeei TaxID=147645 RepID=UPI003BF85A62
MTNIVMKTLAVAALLGTAGAPVAGMAQDADQPPPAAGQPAAPMQHPIGPDFTRPAPGRAAPLGMLPALGLAAQLAATETYLGIAAAQEDVWRDYCQALIAFLEPDGPTTPKDGADGGEPPVDQARPLAAERMAQQVLSRADQARTLLAAATALRAALEPGQLEKLQQVDPGFGPERGAPRPHGPERAEPHQPGPRQHPAPGR